MEARTEGVAPRQTHPVGTIPPRLLVISLGGAGDTLMATPLLDALRVASPHTEIDVLTMQGPVAAGILKGNPVVTHHLHHDFMREPRIRSLRFCAQLRARRYGISFTVMPQNRLEYNLVTWLIGARRRVGFRFGLACGAMPGLFLTHIVDEDETAHLVDNNMRLLSEGLGIDVPARPRRLSLSLEPDNHNAAANFLVSKALNNGQTLIGLHPGSGTTKNLALRRWDPQKWAAVLRRLGADSSRSFLFFGGRDEAPLREAIRAQAGLPPDRLCHVDLPDIRDVAAVLQNTQCFLCCDTLLTHIAAACNVPTVVVMGPTPHTSVYPYACPHRIVWLGLKCSPCYRYSRYGIRCTNYEHLKCLRDISPEMVANAVGELAKV